jgi:hypothetical protein
MQCQQCTTSCVLGSKYTEVNCTAATNRVCSPCRLYDCWIGKTSNVTWCPPSGWFNCMPCPSFGNDYVQLMQSYSCRTCNTQSCGGTPGTYKSAGCPAVTGQYSLDNTYLCDRCLGCNYRQYVKSWGFCTGTGDEQWNLNTLSEELCLQCLTACWPGQYIANLCNGRTTVNTETCANCTSCQIGHYHAKNLSGYMHPDYEGVPWSHGYIEAPCTGTGFLSSNGISDCELCYRMESTRPAWEGALETEYGRTSSPARTASHARQDTSMRYPAMASRSTTRASYALRVPRTITSRPTGTQHQGTWCAAASNASMRLATYVPCTSTRPTSPAQVQGRMMR